MGRYLRSRVMQLVPVLFIVSLVVFLIMHVLPGDPAELMLAGAEGGAITPERLAELKEQMGLNDPLAVQYLRFVGGAVTGDLGESIRFRAPVTDLILDRFGSNEELLAYIDSPAGRRFLEATPIAPNAGSGSRVAAPYGRILLSVQIGVLLLALSLGFMWVSSRAIEEVREVFMGLSIVGFTLGLGCVISAVASYMLSRRLGLLQAERPAQSA